MNAKASKSKSKSSTKSNPKSAPKDAVKDDGRVKVSDEEALIYHEYSSMDQTKRLPGKLEVIASKSCSTQRDLSLAYTPGVAAACLEIAKDPARAADLTSRANLVAVVSNGTAVLGLGNLGPLASKPVMEGKAILFKKFANINVFDIEIQANTADEVVKACQMLEPTVGGINLEDIKSPECFEIEERLKKTLKIPVFHDDQHGTAIILVAALLNALKISKKKAGDLKVVFSGAGAAAIACANLILKIGIKKENVILTDKSGVVHTERTDLDPFKQSFAKKTELRSLAQAMKGADMFVGLSVGGLVTADMVKTMAKDPIIFAMANPNPEIDYYEAKKARPDAIIATGRSDFPNQINNVLGFPYIFRGALDVSASAINEEMKLAASYALAELAQEDVPDSVAKAYGENSFSFGPDYIIPKPFDTRALYWVAPAVAEAAMKTKVAHRKIEIRQYREELMNSIDRSRQILGTSLIKARRSLKKIVFPEGNEAKIIRAAHIVENERIGHPVLIGQRLTIEREAQRLRISVKDMTIIEPDTDPLRNTLAEKLFQLRQRRGLSIDEAKKQIIDPTVFGLMLVQEKMADTLVSGLTKSYPETIRPTLQIIRMNEKYKYAAGLYIVATKDRVLFFADTTVNIDPSAECLAEIALQTAERVEFFGVEPRVALLSFSNFGSAPAPINARIQEALQIIRQKRPKLVVDGEMQADTAVTGELLKKFNFSSMKKPANVLIFPNLASGNIAYKLLQRLAGADVIGPILLGPRQPVHVLQQNSSVEEIVNMCTIAAADANDHTN